MKKKGLSYIIIGILIITILPIENEQAISTTKILTGDIFIESVELIQVLENPDTLVTNKAAVVRIVVESTFPDVVKADIEITYDFGTKTLLEDGGGSSGVEIATGTNTIYVPGGPAIPAHSIPWYTSEYLKWRNEGFDSLLKAKLDPDDSLEETDETNNEKFINGAIRVANAPMLRILYVPIAFPGDEDWTVSSYAMDKQRKFMLDTYPLAGSDLIFQPGSLWRFSESPSGSGEARDNWIFEVVVYTISCTTRIMGYHRVIICWEGFPGGRAVGMLRNPVIREPVIIGPRTTDYELVAHEIGHTYYLWHPHDLGPPIFTSTCFNVEEQEYNLPRDTFMSYRDPPTWIDKGRYDHNPKTLLSPGSYYYPGDPEIGMAPSDGYLSVPTYRWNLMDQLTEDPPTYDCIMVHGLLRDDGTVTLNHSWYRIEGVPDKPHQPVKDSQNEDYYFIMFLNDNNQIISTFPFTASFNYVTHNDKTGLLKNQVTDVVPFIFNIPEKEGTRFIQIQDANGQVLAEREVTLNSPNVQVTYPNGGEEFKVGDKINIEWNAQDQDQDTLRYTLAYSNDNGGTWIPIAFDIKENTFEWSTFGLNIGEYRIKVIASDGINTGEDISDGAFNLPRAKTSNSSYSYRFIDMFLILQKILELMK